MDGSTCGRAGRLFLRIIFLVFFWSGLGVSALVSMSVVLSMVVRSVDVGSGGDGADVEGMTEVSVSAIFSKSWWRNTL